MNAQVEKRTGTDEILQLVSFKLGNEEYGLNILNVKEIIKILQITKVPNSPIYIEGIINLRGNVIPVINLRKKLKMPSKEKDGNTRIIVVEVNNTIVGFTVDEVKEVLRIPVSLMEETPEIALGINSEFIKSVGKLEDRLFILIDTKRILTTDQPKELEKVI